MLLSFFVFDLVLSAAVFKSSHSIEAVRRDEGSGNLPNGWYEDSGRVYYYKDGIPLRDQLIDNYEGHSVFLGADGAVESNKWIYHDNELYHLDTHGNITEIDVRKDGVAGFYNSIAGYPTGQCTGFVASILQSAGISSKEFQNLGDGTDWAQNSESRGLNVSFNPAIGSAISFHYDGIHYLTPSGHVAFITGVYDGSIEVAEGNFNNLPYHTRNITKSEIESSSNGVIHF